MVCTFNSIAAPDSFHLRSQAEAFNRHTRIQKVLSEGVKTFTTFFFYLKRGGMIQIPLLAGNHRPASETTFLAFPWHADDVPTLNAGLKAFRFSGDPDQYC